MSTERTGKQRSWQEEITDVMHNGERRTTNLEDPTQGPYVISFVTQGETGAPQIAHVADSILGDLPAEQFVGGQVRYTEQALNVFEVTSLLPPLKRG